MRNHYLGFFKGREYCLVRVHANGRYSTTFLASSQKKKKSGIVGIGEVRVAM
jgi:hypothetical protein